MTAKYEPDPIVEVVESGTTVEVRESHFEIASRDVFGSTRLVLPLDLLEPLIDALIAAFDRADERLRIIRERAS